MALKMHLPGCLPFRQFVVETKYTNLKTGERARNLERVRLENYLF
jgi:hypothetical protein